MSLPRLQCLSLACAVMLVSLQTHAQEPTRQMMMSNMNAQLAKLGGTMHATAEICGDYSAEKLAELKEQQKSQLATIGMVADSFEEAFNSGYKEGEAKWAAIPAAERQGKCDEFKQQMEGMTQQLVR